MFPDSLLDISVELALGADLTADPSTWTWTEVARNVADEVTDGGEVVTEGGEAVTVGPVTLGRLLDQRLSIRRGRSDEMSRTQPTSVSMDLKNDDGALTPGNAASDWYPYIRRGTPLRISVESGVRFVGQIAEIAPTWPEGDLESADFPGVANVRVTAAGVLRRMGQGTKALGSALARSIPTLSPVVGYWPLEDPEGAGVGGTPVESGLPATINNLTLQSEDSLPGSEALPVARLGGRVIGVPHVRALTDAWSVGYIYLPDEAPVSYETVHTIRTTGAIARWELRLMTGLANVRGYSKADVLVVDSTIGIGADVFDDWTWVFFSCWEATPGTTTWRVAWYNVGGIAGGIDDTTPGDAGNVTRVTVNPPEGWAVGHLTVSDDVINPDDFPAGGYAGEEATTRVARIAAEEGIDLTVVSDSLSTTAMGPQESTTVLEVFENVREAELGILAENLDGIGLVYRSRDTLYNQAAALTLDASANEISNPFEPVDDDQRLRNDVTVSRRDGTFNRQVDDDSVRFEGTFDTSITVNVESDAMLPDQAAWRLHIGTWEGMRYPVITIDLAVAPTLIPAVTALRQGDLIEVTNLPSQHPTGTVALIAEGWTETIGPLVWTFELTCSPAGPWTVGVLEDNELGRLDSATSSVGDPSVDADDTTMRVDISDGPMWIDSATYPTMFPFDIEVNGEVMTVTAVTGTTSPQIFTVIRGVNGVTKAHGIATPLRLAHPLVLAL